MPCCTRGYGRVSAVTLLATLWVLLSGMVYGQVQNALPDRHLPGDTAVLGDLTRRGTALVYEYPDSAMQCFVTAAQLAQQLDLPEKFAENRNWQGVALYVLGEYDRALPRFTEAMRLYEETGDHYGLATTYNHIGLIYQTQRRYKKAIGYHKKGVAHAVAINNKDRQAINNFNIGLACDEEGHYDSSMHYLTLSLELSRQAQSHRLQVMTLNRMAKVHFHMGNHQKAAELYNAALNYPQAQNNWERCFSWAGLAEVYDAQRRYDAAIDMARKSLQMAKKIRARWDVIHASEILSGIYAHQQHFEKAYQMARVAQAYKDSVFNEEKENKLNFIHLQENELANAALEKKNAMQAAALEQRNLQVTIAIITAVSLLAITLVIYSRQRQKSRLNKQLIQINEKIEQQNRNLVEVNETKNRLFSIISHDMRSPFHNLQSILELMRMGVITEQERETLFDELTISAQSVSQTLDSLLQWANSQMEGLRTEPRVLDVDQAIDEAVAFWKFALEKKGIRISDQKKDLSIYMDPDQLSTVLRNVLGNAIKFSHPSGTIFIDSLQRDGRTGIVIKDTGVGMSAHIRDTLFTFQKDNRRKGTSREKGTGLGLMICAQLLEKNGGYMEVQSEEGAGAAFTVWAPAPGKP